MTAAPLACSSRIERVFVYARGALVTRRVVLPSALPEGPCEIAVPGVTPLAELGSLRALLEPAQQPPSRGERGEGEAHGAGRDVIGVCARLVVPPAPAQPGGLAARLRELELERVRLAADREHLRWRRDLLGDVALYPELVRPTRRLDPATRVEDALAVGTLLAAEVSALDRRITALDRELERVQREEQSARLAASQASSAELQDKASPQLEILVRFGPQHQKQQKPGAPTSPSLLVEYTVLAARWWPVYAARFSRGATQVTWHLDALVAQASGEDWEGVRLALSTADLVEDARLPELPSLRLGRAQPPQSRGYRPPPEGLDALFGGFDRFTTALPTPVAREITGLGRELALPAAPPPPPPPRAAPASSDIEDDDEATGVHADTLSTFAEVERALGTAAPPPGFMPQSAPMPSRALPMPSAPAMPVAPPMGGVMPAVALRRSPFSLGLGGGGGALHEEAAATRSATTAQLARPEPPEPPAPIEPADAWLDFDALHLAGPEDRGRRGRLVRESGPSRLEAERASRRIEELPAPPRTLDPRLARGRFDFIYTTEGTADVPSAARTHRVSVLAADLAAAPRFVTVPRESPEVYREAEIKNPYTFPLLGGPVDIFIDGALLTQSAIASVDGGGVLRVGLGVEDRLRVARNARAEESSAGLLGGSLAVDHEVTIDLSSSLGRPVTVDVIDRIPVTDDKDLEIKQIASQPRAQAYTQAEIGAPVRRGLRWSVEVPAGGKAAVTFSYRITLPTKNEIVGGNRRE